MRDFFVAVSLLAFPLFAQAQTPVFEDTTAACGGLELLLVHAKPWGYRLLDSQRMS